MPFTFNKPAIHQNPYPSTEPPPKTIVSSGFLKMPMSSKPAAAQPHAIPLPYPAVEDLPEFAGNIDSSQLQPAARHYNATIASFGGHTYMAYRFETFEAVSKIGLCELNSEFAVIADKELDIPPEVATHYEDPRMTAVGESLILTFAHVKLGVPPICRQRMIVLGSIDRPDFDAIGCKGNVDAPFGNIAGIEKNWVPFELPNGSIGLVYSQKPRLVIDVPTKAGYWSQECTKTPPQSSLSGRTPPLRISPTHYLEFVGGHIPIQSRAARYWFGAQLFSVDQPHRVVRATPEPLVWGTEASMTIFSPRPFAGHPCCILPGGIIRDGTNGENVVISCGVNDSYIALLRYNLASLVEKMEDIL